MGFVRASILTVFLLLSGISQVSAWDGKVVGVSDGDTITVMHDGRGERLRIYGVDSPESGQDFGKRAKHFTSNQVFGGIVTVEPIEKDRYGRTVSMVVYGNGQNLSGELIKAGFAWVYRKYCTLPVCLEWSDLEREARADEIGLWSQTNPVPPWEYRKGER